jgi:hypothetical protein
MEGPDYNSYNLEQLRDVESHIDKEAFPERYEQIRAILDNPNKLKILEQEYSSISEQRKKDANENYASLGAIVHWSYGLVVLFTGTVYTKYSATYIESIPTRILILVVFFAIGYKLLIRVIGNK